MVTATRSGSSFVNSGAGNATLSAPTGGRISTMSFTSGTNKWASRFVVALQLAAWSAVGIVLLEKGIASLQKHSSARQALLENNASHQVQTFYLKKISSCLIIAHVRFYNAIFHHEEKKTI